MKDLRILKIIFVFVAAAPFFSGPAFTAGPKVIVLTDAAGLGDKGFNDACWQGVPRGKRDFGLDARFLQSRGAGGLRLESDAGGPQR